MNIYEKLKLKWGIQSNLQMVLILIVFSLTGSSSVYIAKPILAFFEIQKESMSLWLYYPLRILIIFPCYQVILILIGTLFGQFTFFWNLEKKMMRRMIGKK